MFYKALFISLLLIFTGCSTVQVDESKLNKDPLAMNFNDYMKNMGFTKLGNDFAKTVDNDISLKEYNAILKKLDQYIEKNAGSSWNTDFYKELKDNKHYIVLGKCCALKQEDKLLYAMSEEKSKDYRYCTFKIERLSDDQSKNKIDTIFKKREEFALLDEQKQQQKIKEKEQLEAYYKSLRQRTGQQIMSFYDKMKYKDSFFTNAQICQNSCMQETRENNGYTSLQEALNDGWSFVSKMEEITLSHPNCICEGSKVILKR